MPGFLDWLREVGSRVTTAIETGLRGVIGLPEEIEPYIPTRPATVAEIEEAVEELVETQRFIREALPDEAIRLARGVDPYMPLRNVARERQWISLRPEDISPSNDYQISVRRVLIGPDGQMTHVDVSFPTGEAYTEDEMIRRAASALDDDFVSQYDIGRSDIVRQFTVHQEVYLQRFTPL